MPAFHVTECLFSGPCEHCNRRPTTSRREVGEGEEGPLGEEYPRVGAWEGVQGEEGVDRCEGEVLRAVAQEASCQEANS